MASFVDIQTGITRQQLDQLGTVFQNKLIVDPAKVPAMVRRLVRMSSRAELIKQKQLDETEVLRGYSGAQILELMKRQTEGQEITIADKAALYAYTQILATHAEVQKIVRNQLMLLQQALGQQASVPGINLKDAVTNNIPWLSDKQIGEVVEIGKKAQVELEQAGVNTQAIAKDAAMPASRSTLKTVLLVGAGILAVKALVK
jgi:hypothetical protein